MNWTAKQRQQLFDKIVSLVETKYYDRTFGGHNWKELAAAHRDQTLAAQDPLQFEERVMKLLGELGGGHLGLLSPRKKISRRAVASTPVFGALTPTSLAIGGCFRMYCPAALLNVRG